MSTPVTTAPVWKIIESNKDIAKHHGDASSFLTYYFKGIVNPGESFVYMGPLNAWGDFSEIVPELQKDEEFDGYDFDNFPIKAYLDYKNESDLAAAGEKTLPDAGFAKPAFSLNITFILMAAAAVIAVLLLIALFIILAVKAVRRKRTIRSLQAQVEELKSALEAQKNASTEPVNTETADASDENSEEE